MPLYQNFSDNKAVVWVWKYDESEELNPQELLEPENYEKVTHYHPKNSRSADGPQNAEAAFTRA